MVQVKKASVRKKILKAAYDTFRSSGYQRTSMAMIARTAGITAGNIYRYYPSKFELFYDVLEDWHSKQFRQLEQTCQTIDDTQDRLRHILHFMWVSLPDADNQFAHNLMQALVLKKPNETYSRELLTICQAKISSLLKAAIPVNTITAKDLDSLVHFIFMSYDGFVLNAPLKKEPEHIASMVNWMVYSIFGISRQREI